MWINNIKLINFRNYDNEEISFDKDVNVFYGENAQGKTNILEAVFLCAMGKSFRTNKDKELISLNAENSLVEIEYQKSDREGKICIELGDRKRISVNGVKLKKMSELLGTINVVIFTPDDINILKGGPQNRRKFLDVMISQLKPNYMHNLSLYLRTLEQRNNYLRQIKDKNMDENLLDIWDEKLADYSYIICKYRKEYIEKIKEKIEIIHNEITDSKELFEIEYLTECDNKDYFLKLLKSRRKLDIIKGYTTKGIHRDDFVIYINKKRLDVYGSQGQHRTAILSLKLSELNIVEEEVGEYPVLLLDDFMSELDYKRRNHFLKKINNIQVIITCTDKLNIENKNILIYNVNDGKVFKGGN